jgi:hypothetical protein
MKSRKELKLLSERNRIDHFEEKALKGLKQPFWVVPTVVLVL